MRQPLGVTLLAAAAVAASGCGGSASSSTPLTRAQLNAKASAICRRVISAVDWSKVNPAELPRTVNRLATFEERAASELEKLTPPPSIADEWRLFVDDFRATGSEFKQIAQIAAKVSHGYALPLSNAQRERSHAATELGISECAKY